MSRDARVRCLGCLLTNEGLGPRGRIEWWCVDVFAGVGVCRACAQRSDAEVLRTRVLTEGAKARALTGPT